MKKHIRNFLENYMSLNQKYDKQTNEKKSVVNKTAVFAIALVVSMVFISCKNNPIFASIEAEEKLKDASVVSVIDHLCVNSNGDEYVANGSIYKKSDTGSSWTKLPDLGDGTYREIAIFDNHLLAIQADSVSQDFLSFRAYSLDDGTWSTLSCSGITGEPYKLLISDKNGTVFLETRNRVDGKYQYTVYNLNNASSINTSVLYQATDDGVMTESDSARVLSGVFINSKNLFLTKKALFNGNSNIKTFSDKALCLVAGNNNNIYIVDEDGEVFRSPDSGATWSSVDYDFTPSVNDEHCMSFLTQIDASTATNGMLLIATSTGYREIILEADGALPSSYQEPGENAVSTVIEDSQIQYTNSLGDLTVHALFPVIKDSKLRRLYASALDSGDSCLWAYYTNNDTNASSDLNKWNRD